MGDKTTYTSVHVPRLHTSKSLCATDLTAAKPFAQQNKLITQNHLHGENARWSILYMLCFHAAVYSHFTNARRQL